MSTNPVQISQSLTITEKSIDGVCVVVLDGRIDSSNASGLTENLNKIIAERSPNLLLDLADLAYLTSAGFRAMLIAGDEAEQRGGSLALCNVNEDVRELFEMGGMLEVFQIHDSVDNALKIRA